MCPGETRRNLVDQLDMLDAYLLKSRHFTGDSRFLGSLFSNQGSTSRT